MSEKALRELVNEVKKSNELLEEIRTALSSIDTEVGVLGDTKLDLEAIRSELASIATSRTRKPYARARMRIFDQIKKVLAEQLAVDESEIVEEAHLMDDLDADSLNLLAVYSEIETIFGVRVDDEIRPEIQTVGDLVKHVENKEE